MARAKRWWLVLTLALFAGITLPTSAETLLVLMADKTLQHIESTSPGFFTKTISLTGIPTAESVVAIDSEADDRLIVITREGNTLRPYVVNAATGASVRASFTEVADSANAVAFDALPRGAQLRNLCLTTEAGHLRRFNILADGTVQSEFSPTLAYDNSTADGDPADEHAGVSPSIVGLAATNNFPNALESVLYGIDSVQNSLVKIEPETGSIDTIATIRSNTGGTIAIADRTGFDISGGTGAAYLLVGSGNATRLRQLSLTTGVTRDFGQIGPSSTSPFPVDLAALQRTALANISTRGRIGTGQDVMIVGFIAPGGTIARLIIRGIGPSLAAAGVTNPLADPVLTVFDGNGVQLATNDNWRSTQEGLINDSGIPPTNDLESAFISLFAPGAYTAILSGKNNGTGVGLVEVFHLPPF